MALACMVAAAVVVGHVGALRVTVTTTLAPVGPAALIYLLDAATGDGDSQYSGMDVELTVSGDPGADAGPVPRPPLTLVLLPEPAWGAARGPGCDCACQTAAAAMTWPIPPSATGDSATITAPFRNNGEATYWYVAVQACLAGNATDPAVTVTFDVHATFSGWGAGEIPYNAVGLLPMYGLALAASAVLGLWLVLHHGWALHIHWATTPTPVKWVALSLAMWLCNALFLCVHWAVLTSNGVGEVGVEGVGRIADVLARLILMATYFAVVRGWGVRSSCFAWPGGSRGQRLIMWSGGGGGGGGGNGGVPSSTAQPITICTKLTLVGMVAVLAALYIAMGGWYLQDRDATSTTYVYDSPPGILICVLHLILGLWFMLEAWSARRRTYPGSPFNAFLLRITVAMTAYFWSLPLAVGIGIGLPDYNDEKVVEILVQCASIVFYAATLALFAPSVVDAVFAIPSLLDHSGVRGDGELEGGDAHAMERVPLKSAIDSMAGTPRGRGAPGDSGVLLTSLPVVASSTMALPPSPRHGGSDSGSDSEGEVHLAVASTTTDSDSRGGSSSGGGSAMGEDSDEEGDRLRGGAGGSGGGGVLPVSPTRSAGQWTGPGAGGGTLLVRKLSRSGAFVSNLLASSGSPYANAVPIEHVLARAAAGGGGSPSGARAGRAASVDLMMHGGAGTRDDAAMRPKTHSSLHRGSRRG